MDSIFGTDSFCSLLYRELIYRAANKDGFWTDSSRRKTLQIKRGQVVFGENRMSKHLGGHNAAKCRRGLDKLEKVYNLVTRHPSHDYTLVDVHNYDSLVLFDEPNDEPAVNQRRTSGEPAVTSKSVKSVKNEKNDNMGSSQESDPGVVEDVFGHFVTSTGGNLKLTPAKRIQIKARLKVWSVEQIKAAIDKRKTLAWYAGDNDQGKLWYKDWDSLFRNDDKIERVLNSQESQQSVTYFEDKPF